jgi:hypothetical protein
MLSNLRRDLLRPRKIAQPLIAFQQHQQRQTVLVILVFARAHDTSSHVGVNTSANSESETN